MKRTKPKDEQKFFPGQKIPVPFMHYVEVMAIAKNYVMARRKGCVPFCMTIKDFDKWIKRQLCYEDKEN